MRGLRWILDTHRRFEVRIVNIPVGGGVISDDPNHLLHQVIRKLTRVGVTVVITAGNRRTPYLLPPARASEAITVGGIDDQHTLDPLLWKPYHHNYGVSYDGHAKPELVAPSAWIALPIMRGSPVAREAHWLAPLLQSPSEQDLTRLLQEGRTDLGLPLHRPRRFDARVYRILQQRIHAHKTVDIHLQHVDGTSVVAAIVTSAIARMLEVNPSLTPEQIRAILTATARSLPNLSATRQGAGELNAAEAVKRAAAA